MGRPSPPADRTPRNAPGPFFVQRDMCITCRAPEHEAPELMAFDDGEVSCYFRRQPETPLEVQNAINAVAVSCCGAVQYDGDDPEILASLDALENQARSSRRQSRWRMFLKSFWQAIRP